jgi:transposase
MVGNTAVSGNDVGGRFACPPWTRNSAPWRQIDAQLPEDHLARQIAQAVELLDLTPLFASYLGVGKEAVRPDLLLKLVLYEKQSKHPSPSQWAREVKENDPLQWLVFGIKPSRTLLYTFRDRIGPYLDYWNQQVLQFARERKLIKAKRASLDSSSVAANASRKLLANEDRCQKRIEQLQEAMAADTQGGSIDNAPYWMAKTPGGRFQQIRRYQHLRRCLRQRQDENSRRAPQNRKPLEKILVSWSDPESVFGLDKYRVYRPLYNVEFLRDLDSPFILAYDVLAQTNESGVLPRVIDRMSDFLGCKPEMLLTDSGYVSVRELEFCKSRHVVLYAPHKENDHSAVRKKKNASNQHTQIPKTEFTWLDDAQTYRCPEGHQLRYVRQVVSKRFDYEVTNLLYICPAEHCMACPRATECTSNPKKGRQVMRMEKEELLDELVERMKTDEAKAIYKLRCRTVELNFADMKEHRGIRQFSCRGLSRVRNDVAATVLVHNLLHVHRATAESTVAPSSAPNADCDENVPLARSA